MMRKVMKAGGIALILLGLVGCIQVDTLIKVKPDGSGTVKETFMMSKETVQMMEGMMQEMMGGTEEPGEEQSAEKPEQEQAKESFSLFDEAKLKQEVGNMGEGVSYVSGKAVSTEGFEGYEAVFAFTDINKLKLNQNPSDNVPSDSSQSGSEEEQEYVSFHFTKGKPATLSIKMPEEEPEKGDAKPAEQSAEDQQEAAMVLQQMKSMFKGMKIAMAVEVEGAVVETNATHVDGSRITIMELDFGKLLEMPEKLVQFSELQPESVEDAKEFMKDLPGFKVDMNKELTIKFK
jgi:hypothetical protein